ncbi:nitrate- and nitrite sensing domain-containing protein [Micromonospora arborensis]|uniref:sensor histidine kinase n=1 Tax=Micromonospora arborensis TaxID=2116518 RepID=UPI003436F273
MLLDRLRIRGKLAVLLVIPLFSMTALAVPVVAERAGAAARADRAAVAARTAELVGTVVQELQEERLLSVGYLLGVADHASLVRQSTAVDDKVEDLRANLDIDRSSPVLAALDGVRKITDTRTAVLAHKASTDAALTGFTSVIGPLIEAPQLLFDADTATAAGRQLVALDALLRTDEQISAAGTLLLLTAAAPSQSASSRYIATLALLQVALDRFHAFATSEQTALHQLINTGVIARTGQDFLALGAADPRSAVTKVPITTIFPAVSSLGRLGEFVKKKLVADIITEVNDQQRHALTTAYTVGGLVLLTLLMVVALSVAVARFVALPLTWLTNSAERIARLSEAELVRIADDETESPSPVRLDPIDVSGHDEIGDLARAFERVQHTAARLVERQAASRRNVAQMFGHIGRRTQNLVGRQLALIDRLEQQETDPGRLQHLYRLDHVSSRLRRNANSLVVLSGWNNSEGHMAPLPLGNVVRLALGEIEDFTRVDVEVTDDVSVVPAAIGDLALTLAELMENGTTFSPPHTRLTVVSQTLPHGVRISLVDHGIGMPAERLAEENVRLTRRERLDLVPTELLGLFVVGRLARRHNWRVCLTATPGGGVTADIEIDSRLLVDTPARAGRSGRPGVTKIAGIGSAPQAVETARAGENRRSPELPKTEGTTDRERVESVTRPPNELSLNPALLDRARQTLSSGAKWNAFAPLGSPATAAPSNGVVAVPTAVSGNAVGGGPVSIAGSGSLVVPPIPQARPAAAAVPQLTRRIPGASLPDAEPVPSYHGSASAPENPDEVRRRINQFEAGIQRALGEASPSYHREEGSPR